MTAAVQAALAGLRASFAADSLALGAHWIYDATLIRERFGRVETLFAPGPDSYHKNRSAGDFTHYGDQTFALLESVAAKGGFDLGDWFARWKSLFAGYDGYVDGATRNTLSRVEFGEGPETCGSNSSDLAGASRIAPLVLALADDTEALVAAARAQTRMTHNNILVVEAAEFFARASAAALRGARPVEALKAAAEADYVSAPMADWLERGLGLAEADSVAAVSQFGQSCNINGAFPGVVQLIARHESDLAAALTDNVMAGGDSAARGLLVGLVLGASLGPDALPAGWRNGMRKAAAIEDLAASLAAPGARK